MLQDLVVQQANPFRHQLPIPEYLIYVCLQQTRQASLPPLIQRVSRPYRHYGLFDRPAQIYHVSTPTDQHLYFPVHQSTEHSHRHLVRLPYLRAYPSRDRRLR